MTIGEILQINSPGIYRRLMQISKVGKSKKIELGDSAENLMKHDSHKRIRGSLRQKGWS